MAIAEIQELSEELAIRFLVHFTRLENLESIMRYGIYPFNRFDEIEGEVIINDQLRLDGRLNGISLSISFPNASMFFKLRNENPDTEWVVLVIHRSVLWKKDCAYC